MEKNEYLFKTVFIACIGIIWCSSCMKDEPLNTECDILEAWVADGVADGFFFTPDDRRLTDIPSDVTQLTFTVKRTTGLPALPVMFRLTDGATITPDNGSAQDFSRGPVAYTVTSEDGQWKRIYELSVREAPLPNDSYDFEHFDVDAQGHYYEWYELNANGERDAIWASGNAGYLIAKPNAAKDDYPTVPDANGIDGYCVRLTTRATGNWGKTFKKPIAAGNFFLGAFDTKYALSNTLWTTRMGIPFTKEPIRLTGFYQYQPGPVFTNKDNQAVEGRVDEPNIYAVLYLNHDSEGNAVVLHGDDVLTSPLIVRKTTAPSLPPTNEWMPFELTFEGDSPIDAELLANRGYNLALVFSSSKNGDTFEGAVGSTLLIDEVKMYYAE